MAADFSTHNGIMMILLLSCLCCSLNFLIRPRSQASSEKEPTGSSSYLSSQAALPLLTHPRLTDNKDFSQSQRNISGEATSICVCDRCCYKGILVSCFRSLVFIV